MASRWQCISMWKCASGCTSLFLPKPNACTTKDAERPKSWDSSASLSVPCGCCVIPLALRARHLRSGFPEIAPPGGETFPLNRLRRISVEAVRGVLLREKFQVDLVEVAG